MGSFSVTLSLVRSLAGASGVGGRLPRPTMSKLPATRRDATDREHALATRLDALGLTDDILREAIQCHVQAMRGAVSTRGAVDWTARQRSATVLIELRLQGTLSTDETRGGRAPLVSLTMVQAQPTPTARSVSDGEVIEAER